jgi:uncharacterized membrane protein YqjE
MDTQPARPRDGTDFAVDVLTVARILRAAGGALWTQARVHGELARIEWLAEKQRMVRMLVLAALCGTLVACTLLFAGVLALCLAWDSTLRVPVAVGIPVLYAGLALAVALRLRAASARTNTPFAATREELAADLALLRSQL